MGGDGSGNYGWRHRVEHYPALKVRLLKESGALAAGVRVLWHWPQHDVRAWVSASEREIRIDFENPERGFFGGWIAIVDQPAGFGGVRRFFLCPSCGDRRSALYLHHGRFSCRVCAGLRYLTQTMDFYDRQQRAMAKLEAKLTDEGGKPKRMRWRTFERIREQWGQRDTAHGAALDASTARLFARWG